jgi:hypothetical protein
VTAPVLAAGDGEWLAGLSFAGAALLLASLPLALLVAVRSGGPLARIRETVRRRSLASFAVGILAGLAVLLLLRATGASPWFGIPALLALAAMLVLGFLGLVAEARSLGCEIRGRDPAGGGAEGGSVAVGWLVIAGLPLLLLVGPLVVLYLGLRAAGGAVLALAAGEG